MYNIPFSGFKLNNESRLADHSTGIFYLTLLIVAFLLLLIAGCEGENTILEGLYSG